jgi:hypothetical protein
MRSSNTQGFNSARGFERRGDCERCRKGRAAEQHGPSVENTTLWYRFVSGHDWTRIFAACGGKYGDPLLNMAPETRGSAVSGASGPAVSNNSKNQFCGSGSLGAAVIYRARQP